MSKHTYEDIARSWELWQQYVDPDGNDTYEQWERASVEERIDMIVRCFGPEPEKRGGTNSSERLP